MSHIYIDDVGAHVGAEVTIKGWLYHRRSSGRLRFLVVRDGTGVIQATVFKGEVAEAVFEQSDHIPLESSLIVHGTVRADQRAPGGYELSVRDLELVQAAEEYPITPKEHGVGFLMQHRHLWLRSSRQQACMRVRAEVIRACRDFFDGRGFLLLDAPILTPNACEGTTTLFETEYFGEKAYMTQSGQLYMEAGAMAFGKVYCFGPTFRAEQSKTRRHLTEFWMIEPEVAYADLDEIMALAEDLVVTVVARVLEHCRESLQTLERDVAPLEAVQHPFPRLSYDRALRILSSTGSTCPGGTILGADMRRCCRPSLIAPFWCTAIPRNAKRFI